MRATQLIFEGGQWAATAADAPSAADAQLVLLFGDRQLLESGMPIAPLRSWFPRARIVTCSSGGDIIGDHVRDGVASATALHFESSDVVATMGELSDSRESGEVGERLASQLPAEGLRHVLVFSDGLRVNGSALADGFARGLPRGVTVTGGLAADGELFARTLVGLDGVPAEGRVVAVGLYGERLRVGMGSLGGWATFGPERTITRSMGNVLHELDGEPALAVYRRLIGSHAYGLPATGLLYPIEVRADTGNTSVVRTLLAVDESAGTLTFAGDVPEGRRVQLMRADLDSLIDAAGIAAQRTTSVQQGPSPQFVLLVSCIGRKLLLQRRVGEEVQSARRIFGADATFAGFYSYGELSPMTPSVRCELHNQTMTITTLSES